MELSAKDKILLAIYLEYQKDIPDMRRAITFTNLKLDKDEFHFAIEKLENENLIKGGRYARGGKGKILVAFMENVMPSNYGLMYVEKNILQDIGDRVDEDNPKAKNIKKVIRNAIAFGWSEIKDIAAKTLAEMSKN